jgi:hypothetical protein
MPPDERGDVQRGFNAEGGLLLATDAASEGLNLHHRCRIVIHYELPWSPVRLQQRTGRVDRIGQNKRVHEILLVAGDTAEHLVLAPLARRIASARGTTPGSSRLFQSVTESRVAAAVLNGEELTLAEFEPAPAVDSAHEGLRPHAQLELQRLQNRRAWRAQSAIGTDEPASDLRLPVCALRWTSAAAPQARLVLLFSVSLCSADGQVVHAELVPVALSDGHHEGAARNHLERHLGGMLGEIAAAHRTVTAALDRRECAIAAVVPAAARQLVQAGLFDRRAVRAADARRRAAGTRRADAQDRLHALRASDRLTVSFDVAAKLFVGCGPHP